MSEQNNHDHKLLTFSALALGAGAAYFAAIYKKGKNFLNSIGQSPDTLDRAVLCKSTTVSYPLPIMKDQKIGAFMGHLKADFSDFLFEQKQYDLDIKIIHGSVHITVPSNVKLNITSRGCLNSIFNDTHCHVSDDEAVLLSVFADIKHGSLHFETAD